MDRIAVMHPRAPEIAIVQISEEEHGELHKNPLDWVNKHKVFPKAVKSVYMLPHESGPARKAGPGAESTLIVTFVHFPKCAAVGACD